MTTIILLTAFVGLYVVKVGDVSADKMATSSSQTEVNAAAEQTTGQVDTPMTVAAGSIIKMISALTVVIICIYLGIFGLKRMMGNKHRTSGGQNLLQVLETAYVGPKKTVSLVRVADKSVLIGVTDERISMLTELDAEHTAEIVAAEEQTATGDSFSGFLKAASGKFKEFRLKKGRIALDN